MHGHPHIIHFFGAHIIPTRLDDRVSERECLENGSVCVRERDRERARDISVWYIFVFTIPSLSLSPAAIHSDGECTVLTGEGSADALTK